MANELKKLNICHSANLADLGKMVEVMDRAIQLLYDVIALRFIFLHQNYLLIALSE